MAAPVLNRILLNGLIQPFQQPRRLSRAKAAALTQLIADGY